MFSLSAGRCWPRALGDILVDLAWEGRYKKAGLNPRKRENREEKIWLSSGAAARRFGVSAATVRNWIQTGQLPSARTPGKHARIHRDEVDRLLQQHGMAVHPAEHGEKRILLVDDDPEVLELLADLLRGDSRDFKVETATDGYEALVKIGAFRPSVLVLDILMPRLDGIEVCRRLRAFPQTRAIKILGITGHEELAPSLLAAGGDACLAKPFDPHRFRQELDRLLASGKS